MCYRMYVFHLFKLQLVCMFVLYTAGLVQVIGQSSTPVPKTSLLDGVWDFKSWIEPHLNDIKYHSKYICFRFTLNSSTGKAELHYKKFSDSPWEPEKEHLQILSVSINKYVHVIHLVCTCASMHSLASYILILNCSTYICI